MNLGNLKNNVSLNVIALLGYMGLLFLGYFVIVNQLIILVFHNLPFMSINTACNYYEISVYLFFIFLISSIIEFFVFKIKKLQNKKDICHKYLRIIPMWFFVTGLIIGIIAVLFYFYLWWAVTA